MVVHRLDIGASGYQKHLISVPHLIASQVSEFITTTRFVCGMAFHTPQTEVHMYRTKILLITRILIRPEIHRPVIVPLIDNRIPIVRLNEK